MAYAQHINICFLYLIPAVYFTVVFSDHQLDNNAPLITEMEDGVCVPKRYAFSTDEVAFEMPKKAKCGVGMRAKGKKSAAVNLGRGPSAGKEDNNK
jgi:hypothetical protein